MRDVEFVTKEAESNGPKNLEGAQGRRRNQTFTTLIIQERDKANFQFQNLNLGTGGRVVGWPIPLRGTTLSPTRVHFKVLPGGAPGYAWRVQRTCAYMTLP